MPTLEEAEKGLLFTVNGKPHRIRAISLVGTGPGKLPIWFVDVDGHLGGAGSLDNALLLAARSTEAMEAVTKEAT